MPHYDFHNIAGVSTTARADNTLFFDRMPPKRRRVDGALDWNIAESAARASAAAIQPVQLTQAALKTAIDRHSDAPVLWLGALLDVELEDAAFADGRNVSVIVRDIDKKISPCFECR